MADVSELGSVVVSENKPNDDFERKIDTRDEAIAVSDLETSIAHVSELNSVLASTESLLDDSHVRNKDVREESIGSDRSEILFLENGEDVNNGMNVAWDETRVFNIPKMISLVQDQNDNAEIRTDFRRADDGAKENAGVVDDNAKPEPKKTKRKRYRKKKEKTVIGSTNSLPDALFDVNLNVAPTPSFAVNYPPVRGQEYNIPKMISLVQDQNDNAEIRTDFVRGDDVTKENAGVVDDNAKPEPKKTKRKRYRKKKEKTVIGSTNSLPFALFDVNLNVAPTPSFAVNYPPVRGPPNDTVKPKRKRRKKNVTVTASFPMEFSQEHKHTNPSSLDFSQEAVSIPDLNSNSANTSGLVGGSQTEVSFVLAGMLSPKNQAQILGNPNAVGNPHKKKREDGANADDLPNVNAKPISLEVCVGNVGPVHPSIMHPVNEVDDPVLSNCLSKPAADDLPWSDKTEARVMTTMLEISGENFRPEMKVTLECNMVTFEESKYHTKLILFLVELDLGERKSVLQFYRKLLL